MCDARIALGRRCCRCAGKEGEGPRAAPVSRYLTKRINHTQAYSTDDACTNQAESFFSRLRRAEIGTHHHIAGPYLSAYADEMSWREDNRRKSTGELYLAIADAALKHPVSRQWKGYWQRSMTEIPI